MKVPRQSIASSGTPLALPWFAAGTQVSVLRHGSLGLPGVTRCDHLIRFEDLAQTAKEFWRCLKPGGLLAIRYSNFRLCDTAVGTEFEMILRVKISAAAKTPIFGPDNQLLPGVEYLDTVFRKTSQNGRRG